MLDGCQAITQQQSHAATTLEPHISVPLIATRMLKNVCGLYHSDPLGNGGESRSGNLRRARFLASLGMTTLAKVLKPPLVAFGGAGYFANLTFQARALFFGQSTLSTARSPALRTASSDAIPFEASALTGL